MIIFWSLECGCSCFKFWITENGWRYFADLKNNEKVITLNQKTGEKELQLPAERLVYDNSHRDMYKIVTEEGDLLVSEEHKVYDASKTENGVTIAKDALVSPLFCAFAI